MGKLNLHKILDVILYELKNNTSDDPMDLEQTIKFKFDFISKRDNRAIREKLIADNLIKSFVPQPIDNRFVEGREYQYITFDGLMFIEKGGYRKLRIRESSKVKLDYTLAIVISVSGVIASVYYISEMCCSK